LLFLERDEENERLRDKNISPVEVKMLEALLRIAEDATPGNADGFGIHSLNGVYECVRDRL
jgi:hypothetical protein